MACSNLVVVLAQPEDLTAIRLIWVLRSRGIQVRAVTPDQLTFSRRWVHRLGDAPVQSIVELAEGEPLRSDAIGVLFNRLACISASPFARPGDRAYAHAEWNALLLSWMGSLRCPVINPPTPSCLAGATRTPLSMLALAARVGLPTPRLLCTSSARQAPSAGMVPLYLLHPAPGAGGGSNGADDHPASLIEPLTGSLGHALVVDQEVVPSSYREHAAGCIELARQLPARLLRIHFGRTRCTPHKRVFVGFDTLPDLTDRQLRFVAAWTLKRLLGAPERQS